MPKGVTACRRAWARLSLPPGSSSTASMAAASAKPAWKAAGTAAYEWLARRAEIDVDRIGIIGNSFGSYFATIAAAWEPRFGAVAVSSICFEPGGGTIFDQASPTFKRRFMYMAGFTDEARFDRFRRGMTLKEHAARIRTPYLCVAGERDELCPIEWAGRTLDALSDAELIELRGECAADADSLRVLEAYLDRRLGSDWRNAQQQQPPRGPRTDMTHDEALAVLGLSEGATADEIRAAHRRLIQRMHPDVGGTADLAARINRAKDVLLGG